MADNAEVEFEFDVFLSHSSKDKPQVRELAERLRKDGVRVWFDEWAIQVGDPISIMVERGLERSRALVLVMSCAAFGSEWTQLELHTTIFRDPTNSMRRFIPLLLSECKVPDLLRQFKYVDYREPAEDAYRLLLTRCLPSRPELETAAVTLAAESKGRVNSAIAITNALRQGGALQGHTKYVNFIAITPNGKQAISASTDGTLKIWDLVSRKCLRTLRGHTHIVSSVSLMRNGKQAISASYDGTLKIWDLESGKCLRTLKGQAGEIYSVSATSDGIRAISSSRDCTVKVWDLRSGTCLRTLKGHSRPARSVSVMLNGRLAISGAWDSTLRLWNLMNGRCLRMLKGHSKPVRSVSLTLDEKLAISGAADNTLKLWELASGQCLRTLEGHTDKINSVSITPDGKLAISGSDDNTLKLWDLVSGGCLGTFKGTWPFWCTAIDKVGRFFAGDASGNIISGVFSTEIGNRNLPQAAQTRYTNAKVVLLGESGVGKSGLAIRLAEKRWEKTGSTHGMKVWQLDLGASIAHPEVEREVWLWDLAGQPEYRLVHQLFLEDTALALLLFDSQRPDDPFYGLGEWEKALWTAIGRDPARLLVAARADRGGAPLTAEKIERFRENRGYTAYLKTSAMTGDGCDALRALLAEHIPWAKLEEISTPQLFKDLKDAVVEIKAEAGTADENRPLIRFSELSQRLHMMKPEQRFGEAELRTVVRLLAGQGLIRSLGFGDFILLQPEQINNYAAAVVLAARANADGMGSIDEAAVLRGDLDFKDMPRLARIDEDVLLRAMLETFIDQSLCIREPVNHGVLLVFPAYYNRESEIREHPTILVTYRFSGQLDTIYATLVVRLVYSGAFAKHDLWKNAAEFKTAGGHIYGFMMWRSKSGEGVGEIKVFFEAGVSDDQRLLFLQFVHEHLKKKATDMERVRNYVCPECATPVARERIKQRQAGSWADVLCDRCEYRIPLQDLIEKQFDQDSFLRRVDQLDHAAGIKLDGESRKIRLIGHAAAIAYEAGQIYHMEPQPEFGVDGTIEFKDGSGRPSGRRIGLHFVTTDGDVDDRLGLIARTDLVIQENAASWDRLDYDVFLAVVMYDDAIHWASASELLRQGEALKEGRIVLSAGEPFTALSLVHIRDRCLASGAT